MGNHAAVRTVRVNQLPPKPAPRTAAAPPPPPARSIVPAVLIASGLVLAAVIVVAGLWLMGGTAGGGGGGVDSRARLDIEKLRQQIEDLQIRLGLAEERISALESARANDVASAQPSDPDFVPEDLDGNTIIDQYAQVVTISGRRKINEGLSVPSPAFQIEMFGMPRETLSDDCEPMTNEKLKAILVTEDVGPIRVSMLKPAVESLRVVFEKIRETDVDLYNRISTAGALCVRRIRGSQNSVSSHSFGLAVDLNIDGVLDTLGDGRTQLGLTILADFFMAEGWFWGAAFGREDSMHFEVSKEKILEWREQGKI